MPRPSSTSKLFGSLSIKGKLAAIVLLASGFALFAASITIIVIDRIEAKETLIRDTGTLADMIAATSTAAVAFSSTEDADEILSSLRFRDDVDAAYILSVEGVVFAHYVNDATSRATKPADLTGTGQWFENNQMHMSRPILLNGKLLGTLILSVSTDVMDQRLNRWIKTILLVSALALAIAFLVTRELHKLISGPINSLVGIATRVSTTQDYSIRAAPGNRDEVGVLIESFNGMMDQVARRDDALRDAQNTLEHRVEERTRSLQQEVAERENAEQALEIQRAFLRQIIDTNPNFIFVKDRKGRFELVNRAVAEFYGTTVEGLLGKADADFGADPEEVRAFLLDDLQVMDSCVDKFVSEEKITGAAGQTRWLQTIKRPLIEADGTCHRLLGVSTDISERKEAELALRSSEEQLRQAVKMEAIGRLAGGVAHDFNNLLAVIMGRSELLVAAMGPKHPLLPPIQEIDLAAQRAAILTSQLLAFSRRQVLAAKPMNLNVCVQNLEQMLGRLIGEDIRFETILGQMPESVFADQGQIEQVVMNLVINARDAIGQGGKIIIRTGSAFLPEALDQVESEVTPGAYLFISVSDDGHGMDDATKSRIFEPFFTTKADGKGTGLGLSTVYGIVKQSGGHIKVESQIGVGTTFTVYLPRTETQLYPTVTAKPSESDQSFGRGQTVLVVEDEDGVRELVRQTLTLSGYVVLTAENGAKAVALCETHPGVIDLVLTDVVMPGQSGPETIAQLLKLRPDLKVIYMSGYVNDNILGTSATLLQKPFRLDALRQIVATVLAAPEVLQLQP